MLLVITLSGTTSQLADSRNGIPSGDANRSSTFAESSVDCSNVLPQLQISNQVSQAYHTSQSSEWPNESTTSDEVGSMFESVCGETIFSSVVSTWGATNFSLELFAGGEGIEWANFTETWTNWTTGTLYAEEAVWSGDVSSGSVHGPTYFDAPAAADYGSRQGASTSGTVNPWWVGIAVGLALILAAVALILYRRRSR